MGDMRVQNRSLVQPQPQLQQTPKTIQMTPGTKVRTKTPEELLALQQKAQQSKALGIVGTRAQIDDLKARVKQMPMQNVAPPPELSGMQTFKKYGGTILGGIGTAIKTPFTAAAGYLSGEIVEGAQNRSLGNVINKVGKDQLARAGQLKENATQLGSLRQQIESQLQLDEPDSAKLDTLLKDAGALLKDAGLPETAIDEARQHPGNIFKLRDALSQLPAAQMIMNAMSESIGSKGQLMKDRGGSMLHEGNRYIAQGINTVSQLTTPVVSLTNVIAQTVHASNQARSLVETVSSGAGKLISGGALSGVMIAGGALQIVGEGLDMYQNVNKLNKSLNRVEMARAVLKSGPEREQMALEFEKKAQELENPQTRMGKIKNFFSRDSSRTEEIAKLKAKAVAVRSMGSEPVSEEAKAVANQIVKRADTKFKIAKIVKNVVGIAAGAIAIAVAAGALATPVGWAIAGVALAGSVGLAIYSKVKTSQRQGKIDDLQKVQQQCQLKMNTKTEQKAQLTEQIRQTEQLIGQQIQDQNRVANSERPADKLTFDELEGSITTSKATLTELKAQLAQLDTDLSELEGMQKESTLQLLGASPQAGAKAIFEGVKARNPAMIYLAESVLKVPGVDLLPEKDAIKLLARGMRLEPNH